jgi:polysaccharide export outer membrane protein
MTYPYIGSVYVKDMTLAHIEKELTEKLSAGYVKYPVVSVALTRSVMQKIFSYGEVTRRGEIPYEEEMTLEKAMSMAGGVTGNGLFGKAIVRRKQKDSNKYKDIVESILNHGLIENRNKAEVLLNPDDILVVEPSKTFLIQGEVNNRGRLVLEKDITVIKAILQAGGVSPDGRYGTVKVRRKKEGEPGGYADVGESSINDGVIENREFEDMPLQLDDILMVERSGTFIIQGEVGNRGRFVLEKDMTVIKAILQAGGVSPNGRYGKVKVRRKKEGEPGGYADVGESSIQDGVIENKELEGMLLQHDDILIIEKNKTYLIYGEVKQTGEFVLKDKMTVFKALTVAGGFTKWGSESRIKILRQSENGEGFLTIKVRLDDVIDGDASKDVSLQPGDIIIASSGLI